MRCPPRPLLEKLLPRWLVNKLLLVLAVLKMWLAVLLPLALVKILLDSCLVKRLLTVVPLVEIPLVIRFVKMVLAVWFLKLVLIDRLGETLLAVWLVEMRSAGLPNHCLMWFPPALGKQLPAHLLRKLAVLKPPFATRKGRNKTKEKNISIMKLLAVRFLP